MGLSSYIREDLRRRIQSGEDVPQPLTLANLSEHYGVSFTPVRAALPELIREGWIRKTRANGRLEINSRKKVVAYHLCKDAVCPKTPDDWVRILVKEVMLASLGGDASYLREEALARKHDVGRSVIRQTFSRFAGAGLIRHVPRCGWLVHPLAVGDVLAYLDVRETLELKALDLARPNLVRRDLERILAGNCAVGKEQLDHLDNCLHDYLVDKSGNRYIRDFFRQCVAVYYTVLFDYATPKTSVVSMMAAQHCRVLEALILRAWATARRALAEHIQAQALVLRGLLERTKA